jgi:deoxyribodipyrimidine photo-lyase
LCGIKSDKPNSKSLNEKLLSQWINGTSSDFINANMIELKQTGFMSNRGRQNVASYFVTNNMDWRLGAAYFESQLIDYDACSNWGNWAYLAG